jgi:Protein of unknown function (DUF559)
MARRFSGLEGVFVGSSAISEGVLTRRQLRQGGYRRLVHGVYAVPGAELDHALYCRAVSLVLPAGGVVAGRSAAWWYGAPHAGRGDPVTVIVPRNATWTGPHGVRVHRTDLRPVEQRLVDDVPVTSAVRTAWDVATLEPTATAVAALDAMVRTGVVQLSTLQGLVRTGAGRWRVERVRTAVALVDARAESPAESWVRVAVVRAGLPPPIPQFEVVTSEGVRYRLDLAWPDLRVAVEYEGAHHFVDAQIVRDDRRLHDLAAAGWHVVRVSATDLRDLDALVARIRQALQAHA